MSFSLLGREVKVELCKDAGLKILLEDEMEVQQDKRSYFTPEPTKAVVENMDPKSRAEIEARVTRLENALANLQDQGLLEERIVTRLRSRAQKNDAVSQFTPMKTNDSEIITPGYLEDVVEVPGLNPFTAGKWFFNEIVPELRAMSCMFFDPRYRLGVWNKALPAGLFLLIILSGYWVPFSSLPVVGSLIDSIIMLGLGYFLIKILSAEARRYRQLAPGLPKSLRLGPD